MPMNMMLKRMQDAAIVLVREVAQQEVIPRFLRVRHAIKDDGSLFSEADLAAQHYLLKHPDADCRFDCILIDGDRLEWLRNAFSADD